MAGKVTVMGGGIFGLAAAWSCLRRGAAVRLIEARRIGAGASGGLVGALAPHAPEGWTMLKQVQFDALLAAGDWWAGVARAGGADPGYARCGRIQPLADTDAVARAQRRQAGAAEHWRGRADWRVIAAAAAPGLKVCAAADHVVHDTLSARINPRRACAALAAAIRAAGGQIVEAAGAGASPPDNAAPVIWATGWEGLPPGGGVKGQALLLRFDCAPDAPIVTAPGLYVVPHDDGTVAVGSTAEPDFTVPDRTDTRLDALHARSLAICPDLAGAPVVERWAGVRPRGTARVPVVGPWPGRPRNYIVNGGHGIGFALAPAVGDMIAALVLDGVDGIPAPFRPEAPD